jgi:hypothetical protein
MDEAVLRAILEGGALSGQMDPEIEKMTAMIEELRARGQAPEGRQAGRAYVAANPLEHLGALAHRGLGMKKYDELSELKGQQAGIRAGQNWRVLEALMKQQGQPPMAPPQPPSPVDPMSQFRIGMNT